MAKQKLNLLSFCKFLPTTRDTTKELRLQTVHVLSYFLKYLPQLKNFRCINVDEFFISPFIRVSIFFNISDTFHPNMQDNHLINRASPLDAIIFISLKNILYFFE
jgi:hypothetical protein